MRDAGALGESCARLAQKLLAYARAQVRYAESFDRGTKRPRQPSPPRGTCTPRRSGGSPDARLVDIGPRRLPAGFAHATPPLRRDAALARRLAAAGRSFRGTAGIWVHDLRTGRFAGWNAETRFPAASTVKLAPLVAALAEGDPLRSPLFYDMAQLARWSSNLAANRIVHALGLPAVERALQRLGMTRSTYPGLYRAGTAAGPPGGYIRVTTPRDLGRALLRLHGAALGRRWALRLTELTRRQAQIGVRLLLGAERRGDGAGLVRPWLGSTPVAQKNGWISDARLTAAIVYRSRGPVIVVVVAYRPEVTLREAQALGRRVVAAVP